MAGKTSEKDSEQSDQPNASSELKEGGPSPIIECPAELGPIARQEWDRIVPLLAAADRLNQLDRGIIAIYCNAYAAWLEAVTALQAFGTMMKSPNASRMRLPNPSKDPFFLELTDIREIASELKPLG